MSEMPRGCERPRTASRTRRMRVIARGLYAHEGGWHLKCQPPRYYQRGSDRRPRPLPPPPPRLSPPYPPPNPPPPAALGRASLTVRLRPPREWLFSFSIAFCASSSLAISTKAKPRA